MSRYTAGVWTAQKAVSRDPDLTFPCHEFPPVVELTEPGVRFGMNTEYGSGLCR